MEKKEKGLKTYFKDWIKVFQVPSKYQDNLKLSKYSKLTGAIATGGF